MRTREELGLPPTRYARWRVRSRPAAAADTVMIFFAVTLLVVSLVDALATWPSDRVLISPTELERWAGVVLLPGWGWLMISSLLFYGLRQDNYRTRWGPRVPRAAVAVVAVVSLLCAFTFVGGLVLGVATGAVRTTGGVHQVSTSSLNAAEWTTVSKSDYLAWEAKFLRLDSMFSLFGLVMAGVGARFVWLRRTVPRD